MRWAHEHPEQMAEIASLPVPQQAEALRAAVGSVPTGVRCESCRARFGVRGDIGAAQRMACPDCGGTLELDW